MGIWSSDFPNFPYDNENFNEEAYDFLSGLFGITCKTSVILKGKIRTTIN